MAAKTICTGKLGEIDLQLLARVVGEYAGEELAA